MNKLYIFIIRAILSGLLAVLIFRVYFKSTPPLKVAGLAAALLGLAYLFQYTKKKNRGGGDGS